MDKEVNLWKQVGNRCLKSALSMLEKETAPTAATVETVKGLVETAISIDMLNLRWARQNRSGAAVRRSNGRAGDENLLKEITERVTKQITEGLDRSLSSSHIPK